MATLGENVVKMYLEAIRCDLFLAIGTSDEGVRDIYTLRAKKNIESLISAMEAKKRMEDD